MRSKDSTFKKPGLLAPMPIPKRHFDVWSIDFTSALPLCTGFNTFFTYIDKLSKLIHLIPCFKSEGKLSAPKYANLFFANITNLFGLL